MFLSCSRQVYRLNFPAGKDTYKVCKAAVIVVVLLGPIWSPLVYLYSTRIVHYFSMPHDGRARRICKRDGLPDMWQAR